MLAQNLDTCASGKVGAAADVIDAPFPPVPNPQTNPQTNPAPPTPSPAVWWRDALLGAEPRQRMRASQSLLALLVYVLFAGVQHAEVLLGMVDPTKSILLSAFNVGGGLGFFAVIRSGLNLRFDTDPALTFAQCLWALVGIALSYGITGAARGGVLMLMSLVILFGMFALKPRQSRQLCAAGMVLLSAVMLWKTVWSPAPYPVTVEVLHMVFGASVLAAASVLAIRLGRMRAQLVSQRSELKQALARIQALATHDQLTGLFNRRAVLDRMQAALAVRRRQQQQPVLSLALIDIDHFKNVNDSHGHAAGDAVLRRFAERASEQVRAGDALARWGGEEFLLVLPATSAAATLQSLSRLRDSLRADNFDNIAPGLRLTFSAGVAECNGEADLQAAIERADQAMYRAKNAGRDRSLL